MEVSIKGEGTVELADAIRRMCRDEGKKVSIVGLESPLATLADPAGTARTLMDAVRTMRKKEGKKDSGAGREPPKDGHREDASSYAKAFEERLAEGWCPGMFREGGADPINHPPHYTFSAIEPIDAIEAWGLGFCTGNAVKYLARHRHKGRPLEDLKKARWYIDREIARLEREATPPPSPQS